MSIYLGSTLITGGSGSNATVYTSGTSWYWKYDDGRLFQGGQFTIPSSMTDIAFSQPVLSANGSVGGASFACEVSSEYGGNYAWHAFDGSESTAFVSNVTTPIYIGFYNPSALKVTRLAVMNYNSATNALTSYEVKGSNDGSTWTTVKTGTNSTTDPSAVWYIDMSTNTNYYKYYRIYNTGSNTTMAMRKITITAVYRGDDSVSSTINLITSFVDTNYAFSLDGFSGKTHEVYVTTKNKGSLVITGNANTGTKISWMAAGKWK